MSLSADVQAQGLALAPLELIKEYADARAVALAERWLEAERREVQSTVPIPKSVRPFTAGAFFRPPGSHRCFYHWPCLAGAGGRAVLAFKGVEPASPELGELLLRFRAPSRSPHDQAEHLVFEEKKVPGALTVREAELGAERAHALQSAHLAVYGELARAPLPVAVFRHPDSTVERLQVELRTELSEAALEAVLPMLGAGLGVYVYYYPAPPIRARDAEHLLRNLAFEDRIRELAGLCDPERVIDRWVTGLARMLLLGFVPASLASLRTGALCQPQNAVLDGGFVDLDSLAPIASLPDDAIDAALAFSFDGLIGSVRALLCPEPARPAAHHLAHHLLTRWMAAIEREARPGLSLDARVLRFFTPAASVLELIERLAVPGSSPDWAQAERDFGALGPQLFMALLAPG